MDDVFVKYIQMENNTFQMDTEPFRGMEIWTGNNLNAKDLQAFTVVIEKRIYIRKNI
jgi:hypothetical protein